MKIRAICEGIFQSVWSMDVPDELYNLYLSTVPDFDEDDSEHLEDMWSFFKSNGCYDEVDDSVDFGTHIIGLELP